MSNGIIFDQDSARRIANATRGYEQGLGEPENVGYQVADGSYGRMMLVRTATLPADYTGSMAAPGNIIEKLPNGTVNVIAPIWIKDINGTALGSDIIYQARFSGSFTQDVTVNGIVTPTTYGLFLVQQAVKAIEYHFFPNYIYLDNKTALTNIYDYNSLFFPFNTGIRNQVIRTWNRYFSNIVYTGSNISGVVTPYLKIRPTDYFVTLSNKKKYQVYDYYSDPIWVKTPISIISGRAEGLNIPVKDPGGIAVAGGPGKYLCQWQMDNYDDQYWSFSLFPDYLIVVSKVPTATTGGIGSGIGSGISGV